MTVRPTLSLWYGWHELHIFTLTQDIDISISTLSHGLPRVIDLQSHIKRLQQQHWNEINHYRQHGRQDMERSLWSSLCDWMKLVWMATQINVIVVGQYLDKHAFGGLHLFVGSSFWSFLLSLAKKLLPLTSLRVPLTRSVSSTLYNSHLGVNMIHLCALLLNQISYRPPSLHPILAHAV